MKYLRKFNTEEEYNAAEKSPVKAYVSLVGSGIKYDPKIAEGAYIQHIDGKLYTTDAWSAGGFANEQANGVAVIDSRAQFVIAKADIDSNSVVWCSSGMKSSLIEGVYVSSEVSEAKNDFEGGSNTAKIVALDTSGAAYKCASYIFPNGSNGYLASFGEWNIAFENKQAIQSALYLIGGSSFDTNKYYWTSTQYSNEKAWVIFMLNEQNGGQKKSSAWLTRSFCAL